MSVCGLTVENAGSTDDDICVIWSCPQFLCTCVGLRTTSSNSSVSKGASAGLYVGEGAGVAWCTEHWDVNNDCWKNGTPGALPGDDQASAPGNADPA